MSQPSSNFLRWIKNILSKEYWISNNNPPAGDFVVDVELVFDEEFGLKEEKFHNNLPLRSNNFVREI